MNNDDLKLALIDICTLGKLEIEMIGGADRMYYTAVLDWQDEVIVSSVEIRLIDSIVSTRDQIVAHFKSA